MDSEVPSMQLLTGVISSYDESEHSFLSTIQSPLTGSEDERGEDDLDQTLIENTIVKSDKDTSENEADNQIRPNDENSIFIADRSSWSLVTKQTVKGCL